LSSIQAYPTEYVRSLFDMKGYFFITLNFMIDVP
jgi:intein-encoded DNA endonuclease-like protein